MDGRPEQFILHAERVSVHVQVSARGCGAIHGLLCGPPIPISCLLLCERERSALSGAGPWLVVSVFLLSTTDQAPWRCFQADGAVQTNGKMDVSVWSSGHHAQGTLVQRDSKPWGGRGRWSRVPTLDIPFLSGGALWPPSAVSTALACWQRC